jgi:hypothetical protein
MFYFAPSPHGRFKPAKDVRTTLPWPTHVRAIPRIPAPPPNPCLTIGLFELSMALASICSFGALARLGQSLIAAS